MRRFGSEPLCAPKCHGEFAGDQALRHVARAVEPRSAYHHEAAAVAWRSKKTEPFLEAITSRFEAIAKTRTLRTSSRFKREHNGVLAKSSSFGVLGVFL